MDNSGLFKRKNSNYGKKVMNLRASGKNMEGAVGSWGRIEMMQCSTYVWNSQKKIKIYIKNENSRSTLFHKYIFYYKKKEETLFVQFIWLLPNL